ncbi:MAG TPA: hypothetical protein VKI19_14870 [Acidimicrobiales bacterium]|nr:hypothetical protein [Acidimicrobiales bacterium]
MLVVLVVTGAVLALFGSELARRAALGRRMQRSMVRVEVGDPFPR